MTPKAFPPLVLACSLLLEPVTARGAAAPKDDDDSQKISMQDFIAGDGLPQMSEDQAEDIRAQLNNGVDPDDFEIARLPADWKEESPETHVTSPMVWDAIGGRARQGEAEANFIIGMCYTKGYPLPQDLPKAFGRFFAAAQKSHYRSMFYTARLLEMKIGIKTPGDAEAAKKIIPQYYGFAAMLGKDTDAAYHGARYKKYAMPEYSTDRSLQTSVAEGFRIATDAGHPAAQYELALCYRNGEGVPKLRKLSHKLLRVSAEQGYAKAQYDLGRRHAAGDFRVTKDRVEAYAWVATAISNGLADDEWVLSNLKNQMTPAELEAGQKRAAEYAVKFKSRPAPKNPLL